MQTYFLTVIFITLALEILISFPLSFHTKQLAFKSRVYHIAGSFANKFMLELVSGFKELQRACMYFLHRSSDSALLLFVLVETIHLKSLCYFFLQLTTVCLFLNKLVVKSKEKKRGDLDTQKDTN